MKYKKILGIVYICLASTFLYAEDTWTTGAYTNNVNLSQELSIEDASALVVTVVGETERYYDFLYIKDSTGSILKSFSGKMNETFEVSGNSIIANLVSDYSITKSGVTVSIKNKDATETENLIISPKEDIVLSNTPIYFHLAEGVEKLYMVLDDIKIPIKGNYLRSAYVNTKSLEICAEKQDGKPSCFTYKVDDYNPFNQRFENRDFKFNGAEYIYITHTSSFEGSESNYYNYFHSKSVEGATDWDYPGISGDNDFGIYNITLCGSINEVWTCASSYMHTFPM